MNKIIDIYMDAFNFYYEKKDLDKAAGIYLNAPKKTARYMVRNFFNKFSEEQHLEMIKHLKFRLYEEIMKI